MLILPAIDLYEGKAVRLYKGDYNQMTVYSEDPVSVARDFVRAGATWIHLVDLEGAKTGETPNLDTVARIVKEAKLFAEVGGGIRSHATIEDYLSAGVSRVILGTAAVTRPGFLAECVERYGEAVAVGVDIRDGYVAIKGWQESSALRYDAFFETLSQLGVKTVICTDISRDGAMQGANHGLYRELSEKFPAIDIVASGGVSQMEDVTALSAMGLYGAIVGKAYYIGAIDLGAAIAEAKEERA